MAFNSCSNLKYVGIPESMKMLDNWSLYNCTKLNAVYIPKNCEISDAFKETTPVSRKGDVDSHEK